MFTYILLLILQNLVSPTPAAMNQSKLNQFLGKVNCNHDESVESILRRQLQDREEEHKKLQTKYVGKNHENQGLRNFLGEIKKENAELKVKNNQQAQIIAADAKEKKLLKEIVEQLTQKLSVYEALKESFAGIDALVEQKIKSEKHEVKKPDPAAKFLVDENNPDDEIQIIGNFPSNPRKRARDEDYGHDEVRRRRKTMEDHFNDLSLHNHDRASTSNSSRDRVASSSSSRYHRDTRDPPSRWSRQ